MTYLKGINFRGNKFSRFRDAKFISNFKHFARSYFRERAILKRFRENLFSRMENIENEVFITNMEKTPKTYKKNNVCVKMQTNLYAFNNKGHSSTII